MATKINTNAFKTRKPRKDSLNGLREALITNPDLSLKEWEATCGKKVNSSSFYVIRAKVRKTTKSTKSTDNTPTKSRLYKGRKSTTNLIREEVAKNPELTHKEFEKITKRKVSSAHFSNVRKGRASAGSNRSDTPSTKFKKGTNIILETINLDEHRGEEDLIMNLLNNTFIPVIIKQTNMKLDAVRLHTPNIIEIRSFNR